MSTRPLADRPSRRNRDSAEECCRSGPSSAWGSRKTVTASANETPCFAALASAFRGSHSNTNLVYTKCATGLDPARLRHDPRVSGSGRCSAKRDQPADDRCASRPKCVHATLRPSRAAPPPANPRTETTTHQERSPSACPATGAPSGDQRGRCCWMSFPNRRRPIASGQRQHPAAGSAWPSGRPRRLRAKQSSVGSCRLRTKSHEDGLHHRDLRHGAHRVWRTSWTVASVCD